MANNTRDRITELQKTLDVLEKRASDLQKLTDTTDGRFQVIQERRTEATRLKNEIDVLKQQAQTVIAEIEQKKTSANELEGSIEELVESAEESRETFGKHSENLTKIETKIQEFEKAITEQLGRAGSGALAFAFSNRQGEVEKELKKWFYILSGTTGALILIAVGFFIYSLFVELNLQFFLKLTVALPFIYAEWFASRQYTKERFIVERYAFKAAQAKSLAAFSKTVKEIDTSEEGQKEAQKFVISSVEKIYIAPKLNDDDESGLILEKALGIAKDLWKIK